MRLDQLNRNSVIIYGGNSSLKKLKSHIGSSDFLQKIQKWNVEKAVSKSTQDRGQKK